LADIVANAVGYQGLGKSHPATKTFQAFRIYINDELEQLKKGFICAEHLLKPHGVCMAVTFHSLEDRLTKKFFHNCVQGNSNEQEQSIKEQIQPRPGYYRYLRRVAHEKEIERERTESIH
jgi:16S rRNA (cytosine1402-N4)-methyltransferase